MSVYTKFCTPSYLGHRPIGEVEPPELLRACERVQDRDAVESAHRLLTTASGVWQFAIFAGAFCTLGGAITELALRSRRR